MNKQSTEKFVVNRNPREIPVVPLATHESCCCNEQGMCLMHFGELSWREKKDLGY